MGRYAVKHCDTGEGGAGPSAAAPAGDLHSLRLGAVPGFTQGIRRVAAVFGQSEVGPSDPTCIPIDRGRSLSQ